MKNENGRECCPLCGWEFEDGELGYEWSHEYICGPCLKEILDDLSPAEIAELIGSDARIMDGIHYL